MEDRGVLRGPGRTSGAIPAVTVSTLLPPGLCRGPVKLADGRVVPGILYPQEMVEAGRHRDISEFGGWRGYMADPAAKSVGGS
jgi:hypothetical protein